MLLSGFHAWHLIDRSGALQTVEGLPAQPPSAEPLAGMREHGFELSDGAFARLVDEAEVDALLIELAAQSPTLIKDRHASELHRMAHDALKEMDRLGLEGARLRQRLLSEVLACDSQASAWAHLAAHAAA